jgi:hypothetical protein
VRYTNGRLDVSIMINMATKSIEAPLPICWPWAGRKPRTRRRRTDGQSDLD